MESVIQNLRTDRIPRLRLGIADTDSVLEADQMVEYVLAPFAANEREVVEDLVVRAADACESWLQSDLETTMNRFNR